MAAAARGPEGAAEVTGEADSGDGAGVVVQGLLQTEVLLHVEDVDQPISAARGQELHT